jgi:bacteriorhodopsin
MNITKRRYIDWFITTPTMLVSTIIFLEYLKSVCSLYNIYISQQENNKENK